MKIKLFGLIWDFTPILGLLWAFIGTGLIGYTFILPDAPIYLTITWAILFIIFLATAEDISDKLTKREIK